MGLFSSWTPCNDTRECYYEEHHGDDKGCRILNSDKDGNAPYPVGEKCAFWKPKTYKDPTEGRLNYYNKTAAER